MFSQYSGNILWTLVPNFGIWSNPNIPGNDVWALVPNAEIWPFNITFRQHCHYVLAILYNYRVFNFVTFVTTLPEQCMNILGQLEDNIHAMLYQCWEITLFPMLPQFFYNVAGTRKESKIGISIFEIKFRMIELLHFIW